MHRYLCRVRWSDVDFYGHVNNVKYFEYLQEARIAFLLSLTDGWPQDREGYVVARLDVDYRAPILFRTDPIVVESWVSRLGRSSYDLRSRIVDEGGQVFAQAYTVVVAYDADAGGARPLTDSERQLIGSAVVTDPPQ